MFLIIFSIICGLIGFQIGSLTGVDIFFYAFGIIGFLGPSMFMLERIYVNVTKEKK